MDIIYWFSIVKNNLEYVYEFQYEIEYEDLNNSLINYFADNYGLDLTLAKKMVEDLDLLDNLRDIYLDDQHFKECMEEEYRDKAEDKFNESRGE